MIVFVFPISLAMADGGGNSGMMDSFEFSGMWPWSGWMMLLMPVFWLVFLVLTVFVVRKVWDMAGNKKKE